jgi:hypothetical protein
MADFRALCKELMDAIDSGVPVERIKQSPLAVRVDAALAQPEPVAPTDEELNNLANKAWISVDVLKEYDLIENAFDCCGFARAVLARWGRAASESD